MNVRDVMTTEVISVPRDAPLKEVARLLIERRISGVPVVDQDGRVLGVVSEADFVAKEVGPPPERRSALSWLFRDRREAEAELRLDAATAGEAMSAPAVTITADRPLSEAAAKMFQAGVNRLPVVEDAGLIGIVTRADVVRAYARSDAELLGVVSETIRAVDGLRCVAVKDGVAHLSGTVSHPAIAETVKRLVARIDGVVAVDDRDVSWLEPALQEV